jgi:hypothetical protein
MITQRGGVSKTKAKPSLDNPHMAITSGSIVCGEWFAERLLGKCLRALITTERHAADIPC